MPDVTMRALDGTETTIDADAVAELDERVAGELLNPDSPAYDEVRAIWNAMIDRRPGLIVRCADADDVVKAVKFAREHGLLVSVRGAGHNIAGNAVSDGGLMIDLSDMRSVEVDAAAATARVAPGATLGDVDAATQAHGLALPVGINSTTGIAGLTVGGGFGWLTRKYGLTIDNLISADVVTSSGERLTASEKENPDLFWGIRGGGGNFGIVTSFEFGLHPVGPDLLSGLIVHPFADAPDVLRAYREFVASAPDELSAWVVLRKAPPLPFLPEDVHGTEVLVIATVYAGEVAEGERAMKGLREIGDPIADVIAPQPFAAFQQAFDPLLTPGARNYWKSHDFTELSDDLIGVVLEYVRELPTEQCEIFMAHLGGAASRVPADATAYTHRDAEFIMNVHTRWDEPKDDKKCVAWAREFFERSARFATGGVYVNFMPDDEANRVTDAYGPNYQRLVELKDKYDPDNFFRLNQNIQPTAA
ncbi:MAG: FAD-binding oxidoreductase [Gemmatimonadetes bacterium]|uniref:FAD-binding oxidoreductase n=1 Tax=Candidatus Kutchimonas denitrificans TaxID=3056748 RepID=A0AAE4Z956_9BACT|nr:FAD-binding oxidoreductase [Gemmatimonadota bacterium]NIR75953.1 FAD-binding oxidoreductase [Candidatus Kutchimonas denitrificans]NIS02111.1 FAD-binding oxidoreductase [Gemmatimonadota bacterium]NIT67936.1 FAD-binding oxidoreductase [Gemmatimonadota bacterium]NIU53930.1 FAD-binding protein [Gemmatimonadota bacterium]